MRLSSRTRAGRRSRWPVTCWRTFSLDSVQLGVANTYQSVPSALRVASGLLATTRKGGLGGRLALFARLRVGFSVGTLALALFLIGTATALAALPRTYQVQAVPSPQPTAAARFGVALVNAGDENGDGKDDIVVGTDEHGGAFAGTVYLISGADGSMIRTLPPADPGGAGNGAAWGGFVGKIGTNESIPANYTDIGSCPGFTGAASDTCDAGHGNASNLVGPADGIPD